MPRHAIKDTPIYTKVMVPRRPIKKRTSRQDACCETAGSQLCCTCVNAVPSNVTGAGCAWSRGLQPVPGWDAELVRYGTADGTTYKVKACPEYKKSPPRISRNPGILEVDALPSFTADGDFIIKRLNKKTGEYVPERK